MNVRGKGGGTVTHTTKHAPLRARWLCQHRHRLQRHERVAPQVGRHKRWKRSIQVASRGAAMVQGQSANEPPVGSPLALVTVANVVRLAIYIVGTRSFKCDDDAHAVRN